MRTSRSIAIGGAHNITLGDRAIFLSLIVCGFMVIVTRPVLWSDIFGKNKWIWIFYLYLGASVLWSDYSFVSFKRWVKELGMVIMVLVVLTDRDPAASVASFLLNIFGGT